MSMSAELKVDIVFNIFFCSLGLMVQDDVAGRLMDGIHIHRAKSDGVDMIAERIMHITGFLFLNRINNTSKQNNVCIAHIALYVRIFQQFKSSAIQMAYRIFC